MAAKEISVAYLVDGFQKDCLIYRGDKTIKPTNLTRELYIGDIIYRKDGVEKLKIRYYPEAEGVQLDKTRLKICFTPKRDKKSLLEIIADVLGFHRVQHDDRYHVSLSEESFKYYNLLGNEAPPVMQPTDNLELEQIINAGLEQLARGEEDAIERGIQQAIFVLSLMRYYPDEVSYLYARGYQILSETKAKYKQEMTDKQKSLISWILEEYRLE